MGSDINKGNLVELSPFEFSLILFLPNKLRQVIVTAFVVTELLIEDNVKSEIILHQNFVVSHHEHELIVLETLPNIFFLQLIYPHIGNRCHEPIPLRVSSPRPWQPILSETTNYVIVLEMKQHEQSTRLTPKIP